MIFIQPDTTSYERMMRYIPDFYGRSKVMNELMKVRGKEIDKLIHVFDELRDQFFIETATWNLSEYEWQYGIPINENDSYEARRKRVLAKKRSGRGNLLSVLQAEEPSLSLAWGGLILPFTIRYDGDYYDFKPLILLLKEYAPAHLGYSFRILDSNGSGYTVYMNKKHRFRVHQELISGTSKSGRYPKTNAHGFIEQRKATVEADWITGQSKYQRAAGLVSGNKNVQTSLGVAERRKIFARPNIQTGRSFYEVAGKNSAGTIHHEAIGSAETKMVNAKNIVRNGFSKYIYLGRQKAGINAHSIFLFEEKRIKLKSVVYEGISTVLACGTATSGQKVVS